MSSAPTLDPGRSILRRLSRREYTNTVRDLLGTSLSPGDTFPADAIYDQFDRVGEYLSFSPLLFEVAEEATTTLVDELLTRPPGDPVRALILTCEPTMATLQGCATEILAPFMKRAYRRPVSSAEVDDRVALASEIATSTGDVMRGLHAALSSVLLSPHFLFLMQGGDPESPAPRPLEDHELATRLSYFLWSTMPDDNLTAAADNLTLTGPTGAGTLDAQIARMMADPRSRALTDDFAAEWLSLDDVQDLSPDPQFFGTGFDADLRAAIGTESRLFFTSLIDENRPLDQLLLADYTFANDRLGKHYSLPEIPPTRAFARVSLAGTPRLGFLTQASFLSVTSLPTRTSPPRRASYILDNITCQPPPPPPPDVPVLPDPLGPGATVRQQLESFTSGPYCFSCHQTLNPIGLALDAFDAIGAYRAADDLGLPIDTAVTLPDGTVARGAQDLARWLAKNPQFTRCAAQHVLTYAVGRGFHSPEAQAYVNGLADPMFGAGTWPGLLKAVATSQAFLTNRGQAP